MEKVKIGVLGLRRGLTYLKNLLALEEVEVIGASDRLPDRREAAAEHIDRAGAQTQLVAEFDDLLEMRPDAVMIASNAKLQVEHACAAMAAGCHVLSEIPGAYTQDELVRLRDAVERRGRTYMLGENTCYWDFLRYWRKWVLEDRFGPLSIAEAEYVHYLPQTLQLPDGTRLSPGEARRTGRTDVEPIWRADQPPIQYLTHDLGPLLEILDDRCVSVTCLSAPWRSREAPLRADGQIALFHTQKGHLIKIMVTLNTRRPSEHRYRLFGVDGGAEMFSYEQSCRYFDRDSGHRDGWQVAPIGWAAAEDDPTAGHGGADMKVARQFAQALLEDRPPPIDVYRAIEYTLPGILANRSAELGGAPVAIPDFRRTPFEGTTFWDTVELPVADPPLKSYSPPYKTGSEM